MIGYRRTLYVGILVTLLGIIIATTLPRDYGVLAMVFVGVGAALFAKGIIGVTLDKKNGAGSK